MAAAGGDRGSARSLVWVKLLFSLAPIAAGASLAGASTWTTLPSPSAAENPMLCGVWAAAPDDLHVVGSYGPSGSTRAVMYHYDGGGWAKAVDSIAGEDVCFNGIWGSAADDIYAISQRRVWHYDGSSWVPQLTASFQLHDIWGSAADDIYVVGDGQMPDTTGLYYHYDGTWQAVDYGLPIAGWLDGGDPSGYGGFLEVWGSGPDDVVVMNTRRDLAFCRFARFDGGAWRFCGPAWTDEHQGSKCGLWVSPTGRVFGSLSGDSWWTSYMYTFDGTWRVKTYTRNFGAVWGVADNDVYALDTNEDAPAILHHSGQGWSSVGFSIAKDTRLKNVWGLPSGSHVWVVGWPGTVIHGLGANAVDHFTFSPISSPQYAGHPFAVTVTARSASGNVVAGFSGSVQLADTTGTLAPATVTLAGGVGTTDVAIAAMADETVISASAEGAHGQSNPFAVAQLVGPDADFTVDCRLGTAPLTVQFADRSSGTLASWNWDFGDGATSTERNPAHVYSGNGTFSVSLTVTDAVGATDTATWTDCITVAELAVAQTFPAAGADWGVSLVPEIWVRFNMGAENVTVNSLVVSYEDELGVPRAVAGAVSPMDEAATRWSFVPAAPLPRGRRVLVQVMGGETGVRARHGHGVLADGHRFAFSTFPEIRFDVIQVLEGEETSLLTRRPTVVRVATGAFDPDNTPVDAAVQVWIDPPGEEGGPRKAAEVSGRLRDSGACSEMEQKTGTHTTNLFLDGSEWFTRGVYDVRIAILLADEAARLRAGTSNQVESPVVVWDPQRRMHVEYVALNVGKWKEMDRQEIGRYCAAARVHSDFVQAVYPVNADTYRAFIDGTQASTPGDTSLTAYFDQILLLWNLHLRAAVDSNIDKVVGVGPLDFLAPAAGISLGGYDGVAVEANAKKDSLAAHELMHTEGWYRPFEAEEYVMYAPYGRLADPGWWPAKGDDGCRANVHTAERTGRHERLDGSSANGPLYYSFMGHSDPAAWWVRREDFDHLFWDYVRNPSLSLSVVPGASQRARGGSPSGRLALIAGFIMADGTASFEPVLTGGSLDSEAPEPAEAAYYLDFRQASALLRRYCLDGVALPADAPVREMFSCTVVMPAATDRIELHRREGRLLGSIAASPSAPEVRLIAPNGGDFIADRTMVSWTGSDGDGDEISYSLFHSLDAGASWRPLALDTTATSHSWVTGGLPGSPTCLVKVVACDGFHSVEDVSDGVFTMSEHAPMVAVVEPEEGAVFGLGQAIRLVAAAHDPQAEPGLPAEIRWRSDRDGDLGTAESLTVSGLSVGTHRLTAEATGATGLLGVSDVVTATVRGNWPPSVRADVSAIGVPGVDLIFEALATDNEGDISRYEWDFDGDGLIDWSSPAGVAVPHAYRAPGVYTAVSRVTDAAGGTATDRTSITISVPQTLGGRILKDGLPMPGAPILLGGASRAVACTDAAGCYAFHNLTAARYEVTPVMDGFTFSPPTRAVVLSGGDSMANDFVAMQAPPLLQVIRAGNGRVTSSPLGIDCGDICASGYPAGAAVRLAAVPDPGWGFAGWSGGGCRGTDPCLITMEMPATVHAVFTTERVPEWVRLVGTWKDEEAFGVAVDGAGNGYIAGFTDLGLYDAGVRDMLVAKFDPFGNEVWTRLPGTPIHDTARGIAVDAAGNSYVAGYTQESTGGYGDIVTTKLDPNGAVVWTQSLGTPGDDRAYGVGVDAAGNCYVAGETRGNLDGQAWAGNADIFVTKYSSGGVRQWTRVFGNDQNDSAYAIAVDAAGNGYVTGQTEGYQLNGVAIAGFSDAFVLKLNAGGGAQWTRLFGSQQWDIGKGIALDPATGAVYVTGISNGDGYGNRQDIFTAKWSADGTKLWTATTSTATYWEEGSAVAVTPSGSVYTACFSGGALDGVPNAGWKDVFVIKYDVTGNRLWTRMLGTAESDFAWGIAASPEGNLYVAGRTDGPLGGQQERGNSDAFVWKLVDEAPVPEPACSTWPSRHLYAPTAVGSSSSPLVVAIGNRGAADLVISGLDSSDPVHFVVDLNGGAAPLNSLPVAIPHGMSRTFTVAFAPTAIASFSAALGIRTSDPLLPGTLVSLAGTGAPAHGPRIAVTPPRLHLRATVAEGNPSDVLTVSNTGDMPLAVTGVQLLDGACFSVDTTGGEAPLGAVPATIPAGEARTVRIAFVPATGLDETDFLIVASGDPDHAKISVPLAGAAPRVPSSGWWLAQGARVRGRFLTPAEHGRPDRGRVSLAGHGHEARARSVPSVAARESLGVNETDPTHDTALAAQYPDRSLVWIDPQTAAPQGTALVIGLQPVPLDADDGLDFHQTGCFGAAGGGSSIMLDRGFPEDVWVYCSVYPKSAWHRALDGRASPGEDTRNGCRFMRWRRRTDDDGTAT